MDMTRKMVPVDPASRIHPNALRSASLASLSRVDRRRCVHHGGVGMHRLPGGCLGLAWAGYRGPTVTVNGFLSLSD